MKLARLLCAAQALVGLCCAAAPPPDEADTAPARRPPLRLRAPDLARPLTDALPDPGARPRGALKEGVFARINRDRARAGQLAPPHGLCLWEVGY